MPSAHGLFDPPSLCCETLSFQQNNAAEGEGVKAEGDGSTAGGSSGEGLPGDPGLNGTRVILGKISRAEAEQFPAEEVLPAARAAAAGEAARGAMPQGGFSGLVPVDDHIQASQQRCGRPRHNFPVLQRRSWKHLGENQLRAIS